MLGLQWPRGVGAFPKPQLTTRAQPCPPPTQPVPPVVSEAGESGLVTVAGADDCVGPGARQSQRPSPGPHR